VPVISGGGGGGGLPLSGGTLIPGSASAVALAIKPPVGSTAAATDEIEVYDDAGNLLFFVDAKGNVFSSLPAGTSFEVDYGSVGKMNLASGGASFKLNTLGSFVVSDHSNASLFLVLESGGVATLPPVSAAPTLALGTAYQNTLGYDVMLCVYLSVTVNTSGVLKLGVGPTTTPTQQTLVTGITSTGLWPVPIYLPNTYYALLSVTGTITVAVDGQIAMPV
jgi:hypothetical protein